MNFKYHLYRGKYHFGKYLNLKRPVDVMMELSSYCNLRCNYCYHSDKKNLPFKQKHMSREIAYKIIDQAAELGVNSLKFNYRGEGTLNPDFRAISKYAHDKANGSTFIDRIVNSNFSFPTNRIKILDGMSYHTKIKISFDSFIPEVFEKQRKGANFREVFGNINDFYHHHREPHNEVVIQAVRTKLNYDEDIEGNVKKYWPEAKVSIRDVVAGRKKDDIDEYEHKKRDFKSRQACKQAFVRLVFTWDGMALPCCPDIKEELVLGHIENNSLEEIFNSEFARQLRKDLKSGKAFDLDPCKTCSSFESYKGYKTKWTS